VWAVESDEIGRKIFIPSRSMRAKMPRITMSDQGVREIQLTGKQLVFMFMIATVAAVVIFLSGVMVGQGVNAPKPTSAETATAEPALDPTVPTSSPTTSVDVSPSAEPVASTQEELKELTYAKRLEAPEPPPEPTVEPVTPKPPVIAEPDKVQRPLTATTKRTTKSSEPKGGGFVVQVASLRSRDEADAIARRLSTKGFPSFVSTPGSTGPRVFRVRVGKYSDRREAETIARRLEKEEQFKPWITR
jgi:cell division protein FtsN